MAKHTQDREDLLRDGTAMPVRGRLRIDGTEVVIGFRTDGQLSLYWDQDPVYQFDAQRRLRRVFFDSQRYKVQRGRLVRLERTNPPGSLPIRQVRFVSEPICAAEQAGILQRLKDYLQQIDAALSKITVSSDQTMLQTVGAGEEDFSRRVRKWITLSDGTIPIGDGPEV
jgi:hypothetical protein